MPDIRYAVYYLPPEGSGLAEFGAAWLGWDVAYGVEVAHPELANDVEGLLDVAGITATPRVYGFHGTLKPPFRLADEADHAGLTSAIEALAARRAPFHLAPLRLARLGAFLALVPSESSADLSGLAADCVRELDSFRASASPEELSRRRAVGLTARQDALLERWGYPYVLEEFRFHLTLTGPLDPATADRAEVVLQRLTAPLTGAPLPVQEIALVRQTDGGPFSLVHRYPLTG